MPNLVVPPFSKSNFGAFFYDSKVTIEESSNTVHLIEDWETLDHQTKYLSWRVETGLLELLEPLLEGGAASLKATICGPEHTDI